MKKNKKKFVLITLLFLAIFMGIGYSLLQQQLKIEGTATVDSNYDVQITGIEKIFSGNLLDYRDNMDYSYGQTLDYSNANVPIENTAPTYNSTKANFDITLKSNTIVVYGITIKNFGDVGAVIDSVNISKTGLEAIKVFEPVSVVNSLIGSNESIKMVLAISLADGEELDDNASTNVSVEINTKQRVVGDGSFAGQSPFIMWDRTEDVGTIKMLASTNYVKTWVVTVNDVKLENPPISQPGYNIYKLDCSSFNDGDEIRVQAFENNGDINGGRNVSNLLSLFYHTQ